MDSTLPEGFTLRPPTMDDAAAVAALMTACGQAEGDIAAVDAAIVASDWAASGFDLSRDAWLIIAPDGAVAAFADVIVEADRFIEVDGCVLPRFTRRGLGTALLRLAEARASEIDAGIAAGIEVSITGAFSSANTGAQRLYEQAGYTPVRYFLHMHVDLDAPPETPQWPEGTVRRFEPGRDERTMYDILNEAFEDHWEHTPIPYDEWLAQKQYPGAFDPSLWFIAEAGGQPAGAVLPRYRGGLPWVQGLGVLRPWRGRGLGLALLLQAFGEFYARGEREVALNVDADSPTGATRLYERAGMKVATRFDLVRKPLRDS